MKAVTKETLIPIGTAVAVCLAVFTGMFKVQSYFQTAMKETTAANALALEKNLAMIVALDARSSREERELSDSIKALDTTMQTVLSWQGSSVTQPQFELWLERFRRMNPALEFE